MTERKTSADVEDHLDKVPEPRRALLERIRDIATARDAARNKA